MCSFTLELLIPGVMNLNVCNMAAQHKAPGIAHVLLYYSSVIPLLISTNDGGALQPDQCQAKDGLSIPRKTQKPRTRQNRVSGLGVSLNPKP